MCEVCNVNGENYLFKNGNKTMLYKTKFYRIYKDKVAQVKMCYVHGVELFHFGEKRFIEEYLDFARYLAKRTKEEENLQRDMIFSF